MSCFPTADITRKQFREKVRSEESCKSISRYLFRLDAITKSGIPSERLTLSEGRLRPYLQVIKRHVNGGKIVPVQLSIELNVFIDSNETTTTPNKSSSAWLQSVNISSESDGWLELDITSALSEIWPPTNSHILVEMRLVSIVDCETFTKVPLKFINPAEIPLNQAMRRERHLDLQPLLVISSDDSQVKEMIAKGSEERERGNEIIEMQGVEERRRRSSSSQSSSCQIEDFALVYSDIRLDDVIMPNLTNIRRCAGSCSHSTLRNHDRLATNHAKLMASAKIIDDIDPTVTFAVEPRDPCCVPVEYSSRYLIVKTREGDDIVIEMILYPNMAVERCGCR